jgi:molecular chaperone GrpE
MSDRDEQPRVVIRDKRRIDPVTGEVRVPAGEQPAGTPPGPTSAQTGEQMSEQETPVAEQPVAEPASGDLAQQLAERTDDLKRVTAEYANYRRRVDRDRSRSSTRRPSGSRCSSSRSSTTSSGPVTTAT